MATSGGFGAGGGGRSGFPTPIAAVHHRGGRNGVHVFLVESHGPLLTKVRDVKRVLPLGGRGATNGRPPLARSPCGASRMHNASWFSGTRCSRFCFAQRPSAAVSGEEDLWYTLVVPNLYDDVRREGPRMPLRRAARTVKCAAAGAARPTSKRLAGRRPDIQWQIDARNGMSVKVLRPDSTSRMRRLPPTRFRIPPFAQGSCWRDPIRERRYDNGMENIVSIGFLAEVM